MCDMRAYTEFYACIKKFRTTNKKKYNVCLSVLDLGQYGHPYLHTFSQQMNSFFHIGIKLNRVYTPFFIHAALDRWRGLFH